VKKNTSVSRFDSENAARKAARILGKCGDKARVLSPTFPTRDPYYKGHWRVALQSTVYSADRLKGLLNGVFLGMLWEGLNP